MPFSGSATSFWRRALLAFATESRASSPIEGFQPYRMTPVTSCILSRKLTVRPGFGSSSAGDIAQNPSLR